jgi:hypothetical protein
VSYVNVNCEQADLGNGRYRTTHYVKPVAYDNAGTLRAINANFADGDQTFPHVVTAARLKTYTTGDGMRRLCPTGEADRYIEIGAPYIKPAGTWQQVSLGAPTRTANKLTWTTTNADVNILHAGHYAKLEIELKAAWRPPGGMVAFPVGLTGLTRSGANLLRDGVVVAHLRPPIVYDKSNPLSDRLPIPWDFVNVSGQTYLLLTLPDMTGMTLPVIDPTLTLQPGATGGLDTTISGYSGNPDKNYGVTNVIYTGDQGSGYNLRGLVQFDVSSIAGSTVNSAVLTLYCTYSSSSSASDVTIHRGLTQWYEGVKDGVTPDAGQDGSTWNHRNQNGDVHWGAVGGQSDTDLVGTATATTNVPNTGSADFTVTADVTAWVGGTTNRGQWIRMNSSQYKTFASSDNGTAANRPKLVVNYTEAAAGGANAVPIIWRHLQGLKHGLS